jgi:imidazolonepropionase-like amidohydrolase
MDIKIPPFRDSHIHFAVNGKTVSDKGIRDIMDNFIKHGIFSVIDMGYKSGEGLRAKRLIGNKLLIKSAGFAIYKRGTYGVFLGKGLSHRSEIKNLIKEIIDSGADFIKIINSGIVHPKGKISPGGFDFEELRIICEEVKQKDLEVSCHVNGDKAIREAIEAGVSTIEHGYFISKESIHVLKEKNISWTPTIYALKVYSSLLLGNEKEYIEDVIERHLESIYYASTIGARLNVGTDSGSREVHHGISFIEELRLFSKAGLSFNQIIDAACMEKDEIQKGNFLLVEKEFINTGKIKAIFKENCMLHPSSDYYQSTN